MVGARRKIYWDSCVWLAWIQDENRKPGEMDGVYEYADLAARNEIVLVSAAILETEVLDARMSDDHRKKFKAIFRRPNVKLLPIDSRIGTLAGEIRGYYQNQKTVDGKPGLCTPDALHLATAIHYQVDEFHTFDENDKPDCRALLPLNGNVAGHPLVVIKPPCRNPPLFRLAP